MTINHMKWLLCLLIPIALAQAPQQNGSIGAGGGGSGTFNALSGDATSTATGGATTVTQEHEAVKAITFSDTPYVLALADTVISCNALSGSVNVNLPAATGSGRLVRMVKTDSVVGHGCNFAPHTTDTIDGVNASVGANTQWAAFNLIDAASGKWYRTAMPQGNGDWTGIAAANTVVKIQGRAVSSSAPADTNTLCWNAGGSTWQPCVAGVMPTNSRERDILHPALVR